MRRSLVLLALAAASVVASGTPAQAYPVCFRSYSENDWVPNYDTGYTCASYPYGVMCHDNYVWDTSTDIYVWVDYCVPGVI